MNRITQLIFFILLFFSIDVQSQINFPSEEHIKYLPNEIWQSASQLYIKKLKVLPKNHGLSDKKLKTILISSILNQKYSMQYNGLVLDNEINTFVNEMAMEVIPEMESKGIHIYVIKNKEFNSFATITGNIYINIGLLARIKSEDELKFIIAHEYAHISQEHILKKWKHLDNLKKISYKKSSLDSLTKWLYAYSRKDEFEADSLGCLIALKNGVPPCKMLQALENINYSSYTFMDISFSPDFLIANNFYIPDCFLLDSVNKIKITSDYTDVLKTHPNVQKRQDNLNKVFNLQGIFNYDTNNKSVQTSQFLKVRDLARFNVLKQNMLDKEYTKAIYHAYTLLIRYPENEFLETTLAYALYALSKYKNSNTLFKVTSGYTKVYGEVQQVYHLVKQLTQRQFTSIALRYIYTIYRKYPENKNLFILLEQITNELAHLVNISEFFISENPIGYFEDYNNNKHSVPSAQLRYQYKDFYKYAFYDILSDSVFYRLLSRNKSSSKNSKEFIFSKKKNKKVLKSFYQNRFERIDSIHFFGPQIIVFSDIYNKKHLNNEILGNDLDNMIRSKINSDISSLSNLISLKSNELNKLNSYYQELDLFRELNENYITNIYPYSSLIYTKQNSNKYFLFIGIYPIKRKYYYIIKAYDQYYGNVLFIKKDKIGKTLKLRKTLRITEQNVTLLMK
jgi:predicted Zn-dependent protease